MVTILHCPFLTTLNYAFQTDSRLYLVLDYMSGGDAVTISYGQKFDEHDIRIYIDEIILALEHLHNLGIIHHDVKRLNMLHDSQGHAVLSHFSLGRMFLAHKKHKTHLWCRTLRYMTPEVAGRSGASCFMTEDCWSLGIITCELTGQSPFECQCERVKDDFMFCRIIIAGHYIPHGSFHH
jgi:serine/threonine protein kinase